MKQKITIRVHARCDKCRTDALKVAAEECGVNSVALAGEEKVVVIGEKVNVAKLTKRLDKKIGHAWLETVEEVKPQKKEEDKKPPPCASSCNCGRCQPRPTPCAPSCKCGRCQPFPTPCTPCCKCGRCWRQPTTTPCPSSCRCGRCQGPHPNPTCNNNCNLM